MVAYTIGMAIAFVLGLLEYIYEEAHPYNGEADLQTGIMIPIVLMSWVSVALLLAYRWRQIQWAIWFLTKR